MKITVYTDNVGEIVRIHREAFPGFFLTALGSQFLKLLYNGFMTEPDGICLAAVEDNRILGFAAGTTEPKKFFRSLLLRQGPLFVSASIQGFIRHPVMVTQKCTGALLYRGEKPAGLLNAALLSSLAVLPSSAGRGVGRSLVEAFAALAKKKNCRYVYLTTDECDNDPVNRFYQKCGFILHDTFYRSGKRKMNRWIRNLDETNV